jgi:hypothetical protein
MMIKKQNTVKNKRKQNSERGRDFIKRVLIFAAIALLTVIFLDAITQYKLPNSLQVSAAIFQSPIPLPPNTAGPSAGGMQPDALPTGVPTATPGKVPIPSADPTLAAPPAPKPTLTLAADDWMNMPIIPVISKTAIEIYLKGQALGNNPKAFSKVGDCNSLSVRFLTYFDVDSSTYFNLETFTDLSTIIDQFGGSFNRQSIAVGDGYNTSAVLSPFRADPNRCKPGENSLNCEFRIQKPSFVFITIGTDDYLTPAKFEANLRQILDTTINLGIVPILATKADNANQLNYNPIIAKVAYEYDIPLWNLWRAMNPLPGGGMDDNIHPSGTFAAFDFSSDNLAKYGWTMRNLTALQALNAVWRGVTQFKN